MSGSSSPIISAYLILADISGYTSFLSQTELDHAQEILSDLLETVLQRFRSLLTIHKIEGDAVFAYAPDRRVVRGETLLELIELTYFDFRERSKNVRRHTTCTCRACQSIPMLDLKFVVHHGEFVVQSIGGVPELAGSDVNLAHRLLKNHVAESTGWRAYALFTAAALECLKVQPADLQAGAESYEHLGEVKTYASDLHARYEARLQARHVVVEEAEAALTFSEEYDVTPAILWDWLNDPGKRGLIAMDPASLKFVPIWLPGGRTGPGAVTHCVHGARVAMRETVLDWKPFEYYTVEDDNGPAGTVQVTFRLLPLNNAQRTRLHAAVKGRVARLPARLSRPLVHFIYSRLFRYPSVAVKLKALLQQEVAGFPNTPPTE